LDGRELRQETQPHNSTFRDGFASGHDFSRAGNVENISGLFGPWKEFSRVKTTFSVASSRTPA
jgi:hypothetical protein